MMDFKQRFCRHDWQYHRLERELGRAYFLYRCPKCGLKKFVDVYEVCNDIENCKPTLDLVNNYEKEELWLPAFIFHDRPGKQRYYGRAVAKVLEKYDHMRIDLRSYGRVECVMCDFDRARENAV